MKIRLLTLTVALFALFSCNKSTFNVNVELQNAEGKMIYLKKMVDKEFITLDSAIMQNNIVNFIVESSDPTNYYSITMKGVRYPINFFSENKDVKIVGDSKNRNEINISGSNAQQLLNEYNKEIQNFYSQMRELSSQYEVAAQNNDEAEMERIGDEYEQIAKNQKNYVTLFLNKNCKSFVAPCILFNNRYDYELNELEDFVNNFNISQESNFSKLLNNYISVLQRVDIGQPYLDFTQETPEGDMLSLSELVGKSKLLLIDFWASWCGPCRAENPNVVEVYKDYHEKGFDVLGVSLDMNKEKWVDAIEKDGLIWHNISDLKYWQNEAAQAYGISSIPSNLLLDENGTIIAKNLRGEDLRNKVQELLK